MPIVTVKMFEGRTLETKRALAKGITEVVVKHTGAPEDRVDVVIEEFPRENWALAGTLYCDK